MLDAGISVTAAIFNLVMAGRASTSAKGNVEAHLPRRRNSSTTHGDSQVSVMSPAPFHGSPDYRTSQPAEYARADDGSIHGPTVPAVAGPNTLEQIDCVCWAMDSAFGQPTFDGTWLVSARCDLAANGAFAAPFQFRSSRGPTVIRQFRA